MITNKINGMKSNTYILLLLTVGRMTSSGYRKNVICIRIGTNVCSGSIKAPSAVVVSCYVRMMNVRAKIDETQLKIAHIMRE